MAALRHSSLLPLRCYLHLAHIFNTLNLSLAHRHDKVSIAT